MIGLYEYNTATKEECLVDLKEILELIVEDVDDYETLRRRALRLQYIAERLQEFEGESEWKQ